jgi:hypothetical protein
MNYDPTRKFQFPYRKASFFIHQTKKEIYETQSCKKYYKKDDPEVYNDVVKHLKNLNFD